MIKNALISTILFSISILLAGCPKRNYPTPPDTALGASIGTGNINWASHSETRSLLCSRIVAWLSIRQDWIHNFACNSVVLPNLVFVAVWWYHIVVSALALLVKALVGQHWNNLFTCQGFRNFCCFCFWSGLTSWLGSVGLAGLLSGWIRKSLVAFIVAGSKDSSSSVISVSSQRPAWSRPSWGRSSELNFCWIACGCPEHSHLFADLENDPIDFPCGIAFEFWALLTTDDFAIWLLSLNLSLNLAIVSKGVTRCLNLCTTWTSLEF